MDMMSLRRRVMVNQNKLMTATGNPITFNTPLTKPLKKCVVRFSPKQEGSGTPSPDNVRDISGRSSVKLWQSGKNIFGGWQILSLLGYTEANIEEDENGKYVTMGEVHEVSFPDGIFKENTQYTFIVKSWHSSRVVFFYIYYTDETYTPVTPPVGEDNLYTYAKVTTANKTIRGIDIVLRSATRKFYFEESGFFEGVCTVDDFEPYKGLNEITFTFPAVGKNLCPDISTWESGYTNSTGDISHANSTRLEKYSDYIPVDELENYTFSYNADGIEEQLWTCICAYDENKEYLIRHTSNSNFVSRKLIAGTRFVRLSCRTYGMTTEAQFEKSAEPTTYEPFNNTIYGGYVDLVNGEVVAEYACVTLDGVNVKVRAGRYSSNDFYGAGWVYAIPRGESRNTGKEYFCDKLPLAILNSETVPHYAIPYGGILYYMIRVLPKSDYPDGLTDAEMVTLTNEWLQQNPVTVAYPLLEPIHYSLSPRILTTLQGNNVMWSDANGDITIKYWTR